MKTLRIEKDLTHGYMFKVAWNGGGEVPDALKGHYTTNAAAMDAIRAWQAANPEREVEVEQKKDPDSKGKGAPKQDKFESI